MSSFFNSLGKSIAKLLINAADAIETATDLIHSNIVPNTSTPHKKKSPHHSKPRKPLPNGLYLEGSTLIGIEPGFKEIVIGDEVTEIAENALNQGTELEHIVIKGRLHRICARAFCSLPKLKNIQFENNVDFIDHEAFAGCRALETVEFLDGMDRMGDNIFKDCTSLKEIILPDDLVHIGKAVFSGCRSLQYVHLSKALREIPGETFEDCTSLETIDWPVERRIDGHDFPQVAPYAFRNCLSDENWEYFELKKGVMSRTLVLANQKDPVGLFDMMQPGQVAWIDFIPQRIANAILNHAWESSGMNAQIYAFKMEIYRVCLALVNLIIIRENDDNRAERLTVMHHIKRMLMRVPTLTTAFVRHVLPCAVSMTFSCIGGNGEGRRLIDQTIAELYEPFLYERMHANEHQKRQDNDNTRSQNIDHNNIHLNTAENDESNHADNSQLLLEEEDDNIDEYENHWDQPIFDALGIGSDVPFRYDSTRFENILTMSGDFNNYYFFARAMSSLCENRFGVELKCPLDLSKASHTDWYHAWARIIDNWDSSFSLVVFSPAAVVPQLYPGSIYEHKLQPIAKYDVNSITVAILHRAQTDAIRGLLSPYHLEDMMQVYAYTLEMV